ncbi:MAG: hypothetical protein FWD09_02875 [Lentimicrobiaceae bacterium]|nr:hypothetical protein [Lentimicrobiaceae bacterium]
MNTHFLKTIALFIVVCISYPLYAQPGDTLYMRKDENGKIRFARFAASANFSMDNDTAFLKAMLQAKPEDEFRLKKYICQTKIMNQKI